MRRKTTSYRRSQRNEELGSVRIGTSVGHTERVRSVMTQIGVKFVLELAAPDTLTARTITYRRKKTSRFVGN